MPISLGFWEWGCPNLCNIGVGNYESPVYHEDVFVSHTTLLPLHDETKTAARETSWGLSACGTDWQCCFSRKFWYTVEPILSWVTMYTVRLSIIFLSL